MVSDKACSSAALPGRTPCLLGGRGETGTEGSALVPKPGISWPGKGGLGMKTVFLTSRRPLIVPALRLTPDC